MQNVFPAVEAGTGIIVGIFATGIPQTITSSTSFLNVGSVSSPLVLEARPFQTPVGTWAATVLVPYHQDYYRAVFSWIPAEEIDNAFVYNALWRHDQAKFSQPSYESTIELLMRGSITSLTVTRADQSGAYGTLTLDQINEGVFTVNYPEGATDTSSITSSTVEEEAVTSYRHHQVPPSNRWIVEHNLGTTDLKVTIYSLGLSNITSLVRIHHNSPTLLEVEFPQPFKGFAHVETTSQS